ncbi:hypothetical protein J2X66_002850 [Pseudomonas sp. 3296]|uniref:hypothetical protein n=1 Tax=Pseudomonas sp. 3296 TaxID=2817753 RepID=UPI002856B022|nr:hypothetical protein [Pseudomonas sp. 3296]MDR6915981.1 hypothetical protein [Pseudomonas sp. 3296]
MKGSALKMLLIEDNAILAHAAHNSANQAGVYCIRHCFSTTHALAMNAQSAIQFDVAMLKYSSDIQIDLQHMNALHRQGKTRHFVIVGCYSYHQRRSLQIVARTLELPLLGIIDLPLSSGHLRNLLEYIRDQPAASCLASHGR